MQEDYNNLIEYVNNISGKKIGGHDAAHSVRVYLLTQKIAELLNLTEEEKHILKYSSLYHDSGRINDRKNDYHGILGANNVRSCEYLTKEEIKVAQVIIDYHAIDDNEEKLKNIYKKYNVEEKEEYNLLCKVLKDADALDRVRFNSNKNYALDPKYLRLEVSKTLISYAERLVKEISI